jgi:hypothetical protein
MGNDNKGGENDKDDDNGEDEGSDQGQRRRWQQCYHHKWQLPTGSIRAMMTAATAVEQQGDDNDGSDLYC